ncbi:MAG TPA: DNA-binding response regulator [Verrucomicrobia bacterium]|nr:MAG: DNA-binding response regulator [Lentisphaerae bacterium GWF2_57_35]HBA83317.1 DNA-binding response regulator [Verrucomicrobiota bacterium]
MSTRILIADDHKMVREGLRVLISRESEMEILAEAETGQQTVALAATKMPHVVVVDVAMPDLNGIEATRQIVSMNPGIKIVALSMHSNRRFVAEMFKAGAAGYVLKNSAFEELTRAIRAVMSGHTYISPAVAGGVVEDFVRNPSPSRVSSVFTILTDREREVLQLMSEGRSTKETAGALKVSVKTVETHRRHIMDKLNLHSVAELTKYAIREGITSMDC